MMSQLAQQLIAGHAAAQLCASEATAGHDDPVTIQETLFPLHTETQPDLAEFFHFKAGTQRNIGPFHRKAQHIHHRICLVRIRIHPARILRDRKQSQI